MVGLQTSYPIGPWPIDLGQGFDATGAYFICRTPVLLPGDASTDAERSPYPNVYHGFFIHAPSGKPLRPGVAVGRACDRQKPGDPRAHGAFAHCNLLNQMNTCF
jgi:hypothetical protein